VSYDVTFLDPRHDPEPAGWEPWRTATGRWANWAWPVLRAGAWHSRDPLLVALLRRHPADAGGRDFAGVVTASVRGAVPRARFCAADGWPLAGGVDVTAPQSSAQPGWWFDTTDPGCRADMFRAYTRALRRERRLAAAAVLWRQVPPADLPLLRRRVLTRATEPVAVLDTPFADRDAWLATLRKSRRTDLRRITRALDRDADVAVRAGAVAGVVSAAELTRLARLNFDRHATVRMDRRTGMRTHGWHRALLDRDDVTAVAYRDGGGRLLGAGVVLDHAARPLWLSWGAEPDVRKHLYFDLYCRIVDIATARGTEAVVLGKGMAELKSDLGARLEPQYAVVCV
jgi:hypothetical protein